MKKLILNMATAAQLQQLSGVGQKKAEAIIEYRNRHGKFKRIEDLQLVKGIGPALLAKNRHRLGI
ncbi:ComEA family DNA-binding protein [Acinetobacter indicus]